MSNRLILIAVAALVIGAIAWRLYPQAPAGSDGGGEPIVAVTVPELDPAARAGEAAFNEKCAGCHGGNAAGQAGVAPPLVHVIYEPNHHGDQSFYLAARRGVRSHHWPFGDMPPVEGITDREVGQIITYVRTLQRANGIN
jgi:mono/diheme cytochrome c family protein